MEDPLESKIKELGEPEKKDKAAVEVLELIKDSTEEVEKEDKGKKPLALP